MKRYKSTGSVSFPHDESPNNKQIKITPTNDHSANNNNNLFSEMAATHPTLILKIVT
jgi:hypothetical protein